MVSRSVIRIAGSTALAADIVSPGGRNQRYRQTPRTASRQGIAHLATCLQSLRSRPSRSGACTVPIAPLDGPFRDLRYLVDIRPRWYALALNPPTDDAITRT